MKTLKFRHALVREILEGRKTVTWRLFDEKDLKVGDKFTLIDWESREEFANAEIMGVQEKKLGEIEDADLEGHEKYESKEEMLRYYRSITENELLQPQELR